MARPRSDRLPSSQLHYLRMLAGGSRNYTIANSSLTALLNRGLVQRGAVVSGDKRLWWITDAGRRALSEGEAQ